MGNNQLWGSVEVPEGWCRAWRLYAKWGRAVGDAAEIGQRDAACRTIQRITGTFQALVKSETVHLADLLESSDRQLAPLSDPLRLGFHGHRWLDLQHEREESYSDWLAWLLERMDSPEQVLQVFGLENTELGKLVGDKEVTVSREESISTLDGRKRTDIVIRFGNEGVLLVEVKIRELEEVGGAENVPIYHRWLEGVQPDPKRRHAILLVPTPIEPPCDEWDVRTWEDVSLNLRRQAAQHVSTQGKSMLTAITLCFAGAVEQNVLGLDGTGAAISAPQTALYLEQFLKEVNHGTTTVPS